MRLVAIVIPAGTTRTVAAGGKATFSGSPEVRIEIVPGASHLFEEPGALERVAALAARWFEDHLPPPADAS